MTDSDVWESNPDLIKKFIDQRSDYEQLATEVSYIVKKRLDELSIQTSSISLRAKTLESFLEKLNRKKYENPLQEITDYAGVRIVSLYMRDLELIEEMLGDEFEIIEKVDKLNDMSVDQFGYGAVHFIVELGRKSSGARYDDLKELKCEIQIKTVLQDAWAVVAHHLVYKNESDIPKPLQRKINSLAGLFEVADSQFQQVFDERREYVEGVKQKLTDTNEFLATEINIDSLTEYLNWKFPDRDIEAVYGRSLASVTKLLKIGNFSTLSDVDGVLEQGEGFRDFCFESEDENYTREQLSATVELARALAGTSRVVRESGEISAHYRDLAEKYLGQGE